MTSLARQIRRTQERAGKLKPRASVLEQYNDKLHARCKANFVTSVTFLHPTKGYRYINKVRRYIMTLSAHDRLRIVAGTITKRKLTETVDV